jgi:hypothetical protein
MRLDLQIIFMVMDCTVVGSLAKFAIDISVLPIRITLLDEYHIGDARETRQHTFVGISGS